MFDFLMLMFITWYFQFSLSFVCFWQSLEFYKRKKKGEIISESIRRAVGYLWHWNSLFLTSRTRPWYAGFWIHLDLPLHHRFTKNTGRLFTTAGVRTQGKSWTPRCLQPGESSHHCLPYPLASTSCSSSYPAPPSSSPLSVSAIAIIPAYWGGEHIIYLFPKWLEFNLECATIRNYENYLISLDLVLLWSIHWRRWFIPITTQLYYTG